jgi:hypothetical protein
MNSKTNKMEVFMKQQKKSKFFTFIFSFIPGAAEMYMGFMKQGLSLMALMAVSIVGTVYGMGFFFVPVMVLVWFYSFFHARNLAALSAEEFGNLSDTFIWEGFAEDGSFKLSSPTIRKWAAGILMVLGAVILWDNFSYMIINIIPDRYWDELYPMIDRFPQVVIAVLIIFIGLKLMAGKKEELHGDER